MRCISFFVALFATIFLLHDCSMNNTVRTKGDVDILLWTSENPNPKLNELRRPGWIYNLAVVTPDGMATFSGASDKYATESHAIRAAELDSRVRATNYLQSEIVRLAEELRGALGVSSEILNPSVISREYITEYSQAVLSGIKTTKIYTEKWRSGESGKIYYLAFVLSVIPADGLEKRAKNTATEFFNKKAAEAGIEQMDLVNKKLKEFKLQFKNQ